MWSFYFIMLEFLHQPLPWANVPHSAKDDLTEDVGSIKAMCLADPQKYLWTNPHTQQDELKNIFCSIQHLAYPDRPNYEYIHQQLVGLLTKERCEAELTHPESVGLPCELLPGKVCVSA